MRFVAARERAERRRAEARLAFGVENDDESVTIRSWWRRRRRRAACGRRSTRRRMTLRRTSAPRRWPQGVRHRPACRSWRSGSSGMRGDASDPPLTAGNRPLLVGVGSDQACVDRKPFSAKTTSDTRNPAPYATLNAALYLSPGAASRKRTLLPGLRTSRQLAGHVDELGVVHDIGAPERRS